MADSVNDFKDLIVWQKSMDLVVDVYELTKTFPKEEMFGLVSQIRRSGVSISANIAEGKSRNTRGEYRQFLGISYGSAAELETLLLLSERLGFGDKSIIQKINSDLTIVQKMLNSLNKSLK